MNSCRRSQPQHISLLGFAHVPQPACSNVQKLFPNSKAHEKGQGKVHTHTWRPQDFGTFFTPSFVRILCIEHPQNCGVFLPLPHVWSGRHKCMPLTDPVSPCLSLHNFRPAAHHHSTHIRPLFLFAFQERAKICSDTRTITAEANHGTLLRRRRIRTSAATRGPTGSRLATRSRSRATWRT